MALVAVAPVAAVPRARAGQAVTAEAAVARARAGQAVTAEAVRAGLAALAALAGAAAVTAAAAPGLPGAAAAAPTTAAVTALAILGSAGTVAARVAAGAAVRGAVPGRVAARGVTTGGQDGTTTAMPAAKPVATPSAISAVKAAVAIPAVKTGVAISAVKAAAGTSAVKAGVAISAVKAAAPHGAPRVIPTGARATAAARTGQGARPVRSAGTTAADSAGSGVTERTVGRHPAIVAARVTAGSVLTASAAMTAGRRVNARSGRRTDVIPSVGAADSASAVVATVSRGVTRMTVLRGAHSDITRTGHGGLADSLTTRPDLASHLAASGQQAGAVTAGIRRTAAAGIAVAGRRAVMMAGTGVKLSSVTVLSVPSGHPALEARPGPERGARLTERGLVRAALAGRSGRAGTVASLTLDARGQPLMAGGKTGAGVRVAVRTRRRREFRTASQRTS